MSLLRAQRGLVNASVLPRVFQVQLPDEPQAAAPDGGASVDKTAKFMQSMKFKPNFKNNFKFNKGGPLFGGDGPAAAAAAEDVATQELATPLEIDPPPEGSIIGPFLCGIRAAAPSQALRGRALPVEGEGGCLVWI